MYRDTSNSVLLITLQGRLSTTMQTSSLSLHGQSTTQ